jgi:hypothetical protein
MSGVFDEIRKSQEPKPKINGKIWVTLLIEFDIAGNAKILRSFSKPAKESSIKFLKKEKKKQTPIKINTESKEESLF